MSTIKLILSSLVLAVCLVIALTAMGANSDEDDRRKELEEGFPALEKYLLKKGLSNDEEYLKAAKKAQWMRGWDNYRATGAKIYVYLNEFKSCNAKAINYMFYVLEARPTAQPGLEQPVDAPESKSFIDKLLESSLVRASNKCKSYLEDLHNETEAQVDLKSKRLLYELMTPEAIHKRAVDNLYQVYVDKTLSHPVLGPKIMAMNEKKLVQYYEDYIYTYFLRPCRRYVEVMSPVAASSKRLAQGGDKLRKLFDPVSEELSNSIYRFMQCYSKDDMMANFMHIQARKAAAMVLNKREAIR